MPFCQGCGTEVQPTAAVCLSCGRALAQAPPTYGTAPPMYQYGGAPGYAPVGPPPANYLVQSILTTLFCCLPAGVVAIVYATQVGTKHAAGDYMGALDASKKAKLWSTISFGASAGLILLYIAFFALAAIAGTA